MSQIIGGDCDEVSNGMGFDTRLYDLAMSRILELERELLYARRAELENGRLLKQLDSMREQRDEIMGEIAKLPAPPEDFGDGPYERVDWTLNLLEQKRKATK